MILTSIDLNYWYELEISTSEHGNDREKSISFELNNLGTDTPEKEKVPYETTFVMSIEDAKQLYAWLSEVLVKPKQI